MENPSVKVMKPIKPCPKCPHRLSDLWMHEVAPEPEPTIPEAPEVEMPGKDTNNKELTSTVEAHNSIDEATNASLPPTYPVSTSEQSNPPDYSEEAHNSSEADEKLHGEAEPNGADDSPSSPAGIAHKKFCPVCELLPPQLREPHECYEVEKDGSTEHQEPQRNNRYSSSPKEWDHLYTCPSCFGEHPKLVQNDTKSATLSGSRQGESSKSTEDKEVLGERKQTTSNWPKIVFKVCPNCKERGAPDFEEHAESDDEEHEDWKEFVEEKKKMPPLHSLFPGEQEEDIEDDLEEGFDDVKK
jgi:ubiquitin